MLGGRFGSYGAASEPTTVYQDAALPLLSTKDDAGAVSAGLARLATDARLRFPVGPGLSVEPAAIRVDVMVPVACGDPERRAGLVIGGAALGPLRRRAGSGRGGGYFASSGSFGGGGDFGGGGGDQGGSTDWGGVGGGDGGGGDAGGGGGDAGGGGGDAGGGGGDGGF